jgi:hypothetical protein
MDRSNVSGTSGSGNGFTVAASGSYLINVQAIIQTPDLPYAPFWMYLKVNNSLDPNQSSFINWGNVMNSGYGMITLTAENFLNAGDVLEVWINTTATSGIVYTAASGTNPQVPSIRLVTTRIA